jgi:hypothetical protein
MFVLPTVVRRPGQRIDPRGDAPDGARRAVQPAVEAFQSHGDDQLARVQPPGAQQLSAALGAAPRAPSAGLIPTSLAPAAIASIVLLTSAR